MATFSKLKSDHWKVGDPIRARDLNSIVRAVNKVPMLPGMFANGEFMLQRPVRGGTGSTTTTTTGDVTMGVVMDEDGLGPAHAKRYVGESDVEGWIIEPGRTALVQPYELFSGSADPYGGYYPGDDVYDVIPDGDMVSAVNFDPVAHFTYGTLVFMIPFIGNSVRNVISGACVSYED